jgi:hypothetical protein
MRIRDNENGQVLAITALAMTVLFGFLALAVDVGVLFRARRNMQIAADSAAFGAAMDYLYNGSKSSAQTAGKADATANGFTDGTKGAVVSVNCPPTSGPNTGGGGCNGFFEAILTQPNSTIFMGFFNQSSVKVAARAVAGTPAATTACVYVLSPTAPQAMELQGSFNLTAANCGIIIDSSNSDALDFTGSGGSLTAGSVTVVGGAGGKTGDSNTPITTGAVPISDPLQIAGPTPANGLCTSTSSVKTLTGTIPPPAGGVVCYTNAKGVTMTNVLLGTGTYVFENGVTLGGSIATDTGGATIDVQGGSLAVNTGTVLSLVAPTTGTYHDIALMEPASNTSPITIQKGDASGSITGIIYAPTADLFLQDSGGDKKGGLTLTSDLIVGTLTDKTAAFTITPYSGSHPTTPLKTVTLVE